MNVRITPRGCPNRSDVYTGVQPGHVYSDGRVLFLGAVLNPFWNQWQPAETIPLAEIAEIALDEDGAVT